MYCLMFSLEKLYLLGDFYFLVLLFSEINNLFLIVLLSGDKLDRDNLLYLFTFLIDL